MNDKSLIIEIKNLNVESKDSNNLFSRNKTKSILSDISLSIERSEVLGIAGETGSGKTTLAFSIAGILKLTNPGININGQIQYFSKDGNAFNMESLNRKTRKSLGNKIHMIFQNPAASFNPRQTFFKSLYLPVKINQLYLSKEDIISKILNMISILDLSPSHLDRYPEQVSGGECQRLSIARGLLLDPDLLILDEPLSMLDSITKSGIIGLLERIKKLMNTSLIIISHDISSLCQISDRIAVLNKGSIVDMDTSAGLSASRNTYTLDLLNG